MNRLLFWPKVCIGREDDCWYWQAARNKDGYGSFGTGDGKTDLAHRLAWKDNNGEIPEGMYVLHSCDEPSCVNPRHLFLGTQADNVADCAKKGRRNQSRIRKLTPKQRSDIAAAYQAGGWTQDVLARMYGVSQATISYIARQV